jgi:electron transfer flavoprotein alpha subunit
MSGSLFGLRVAVLVKQVPKFEQMALGADGRLLRDGCELELNPYCRRAVSKGVELARESGGSCTVLTLGPPSAEDCLREAIAWGADDGVLVTDPAFAGSDTLATARAMAAAVRRSGPFDLVLAGRNSVDADTGQVGPEVAELLGLPFLGGVRELALDGHQLSVRCEYDDGFAEAEIALPAVVSAAERLCQPAKRRPEQRAEVPAWRISRLAAADLGDGPWGQEGSPTRVGSVRVHDVARESRVLTGPVVDQVEQAVAALRSRQALGEPTVPVPAEAVPAAQARGGRIVAVVCEPGRDREARELLGTAAVVAAAIGGRVTGVTLDGPAPPTLASWGADEHVAVSGVRVAEDVAAAVAGWAEQTEPWALLATATMWGREVCGRVAARLGAGLTGDAVELGVDAGRLVGWKPAFGGRMVAAITATSQVQMVTLRPGVLALLEPRSAREIPSYDVIGEPRSRVRLVRSGRDDDVEALLVAPAVVGVGTGVPPEDYPLLDPLRQTLGAELAATRKVTDKGWQPRARQVGLTGRSIAPRLYVSLGASGKYNHMVGVRRAGTVLAVNADPTAPVVEHADVVITADWHDAVPLLVEALETELAPQA